MGVNIRALDRSSPANQSAEMGCSCFIVAWIQPILSEKIFIDGHLHRPTCGLPFRIEFSQQQIIVSEFLADLYSVVQFQVF